MVYNINSPEIYHKEYQRSLDDRENFWAEIATNFRWFKNWQQVLDYNFNEPRIEWFKGGTTNISYNCLDRHIIEENCDETIKDKIAIIFEPNNPDDEVQKITYTELHDKVRQFANLLIAHGVKRGDRICIYMPMIPEAAIAMLACARIGAIHTVVFAGFSAHALAGRIKDCDASMLITSDLLFRGDKTIKLFDIAREALATCDSVTSVILYRRNHEENYFDVDEEKKAKIVAPVLIWQDEIEKHKYDAPFAEVDSEHPLFILYTSGSTGKPKGIMHSHGGYMVYAAYTFKNVFQYHSKDVFFCTADIGWITGHSYLIYGPLLNGATTVMFEGVPTYPKPSRFWQIIEKHEVNIFYTAPTAIRALMQKGDKYVDGYNLESLKTLGTVGEPINQEAWDWYNKKIGGEKCPIVDSWWQTETGGIMISAISRVTPSIATYAGKPLCGVQPKLLDDEGVEISEINKTGNLCIAKPWPGMARGIWGDKQKFYDTYFARFKGYYFSGDGAFKNIDGLFRIVGRVDDVLNVSGHRLGTAEIENIVNMHENIAESAVIGFKHEIKGEGICVFAIAKKMPQDEEEKTAIKNAIIELIKEEIGSIAKPDQIYVVADLPKTRSGKIMRRILKKIVAKEEDLGDVSTLLNPEIVAQISSLVL